MMLRGNFQIKYIIPNMTPATHKNNFTNQYQYAIDSKVGRVRQGDNNYPYQYRIFNIMNYQ
jgi:hypothetical protein